jgi:hypothetical protein
LAGHVFVTRSDITRIRCDAWLLPTDRFFSVTKTWRKLAPAHALQELGDPIFKKRWDDGKCAPLACTPWHEGAGLSPAPIPVLTDVGGTYETPVSWYLKQIRAFVDVALPIANSHKKWRSKPLLAINFVGTGRGGLFAQKGEMAEAILAELRQIVAEHDTDIALILYSEPAHAAAQSKRSSADWDALSADVRKHAATLAASARKGNLVLFLGAGISQQAGLPMWKELLDRLADRAAMPKDEVEALKLLYPLDAAAVLESRLKRNNLDLRNEVAKMMLSECFGLGHALAAGLPVKESVTTNYDDLFERAVDAGTGERMSILPYEPSSESKRWLLKVHGSVKHVDDIVLTREDFLRYENGRAALYGIVQAMLMTRHLLFLGFSLDDDNFHRLADEVRQAVEGRRTQSQALERRTFGSILVRSGPALSKTLWENELELISLHATRDPLEYAREVEIVLDYILHHAKTLSSHVLDEAYASGLSAEQFRLKKALIQLRSVLHTDDAASDLYEPVRRLLEEYGGGYGQNQLDDQITSLI